MRPTARVCRSDDNQDAGDAALRAGEAPADRTAAQRSKAERENASAAVARAALQAAAAKSSGKSSTFCSRVVSAQLAGHPLDLCRLAREVEADRWIKGPSSAPQQEPTARAPTPHISAHVPAREPADRHLAVDRIAPRLQLVLAVPRIFGAAEHERGKGDCREAAEEKGAGRKAESASAVECWPQRPAFAAAPGGRGERPRGGKETSLGESSRTPAVGRPKPSTSIAAPAHAIGFAEVKVRLHGSDEPCAQGRVRLGRKGTGRRPQRHG